MFGNASRWARQKSRCTVGSLDIFCNVVKPLCTPDQRQSMGIFVITIERKKGNEEKWIDVWMGSGEVSDFNFLQGGLVIAVFFYCKNVSFSYVFKLP